MSSGTNQPRIFQLIEINGKAHNYYNIITNDMGANLQLHYSPISQLAMSGTYSWHFHYL